MKYLYGYLMLISCIVLYGCSGVSKEIARRYVDQRSDVYHEVGAEEKPSHDMADLVIKAQIKTNTDGFYILESKKSPHGKPTYPFLLNIGGQHVVWQMIGRLENTSYYDKDGKQTADGGPGMRYMLGKKIRITPGTHKVFIALPSANYSKEFDIVLSKGALFILDLSPIYLRDIRRRQSYLRGTKDFKVVLSAMPMTKSDTNSTNIAKQL